jgi:hypothetical protein
MAIELDAFCIVRVLFCQRYLSRPNRLMRLDLQDATRRRPLRSARVLIGEPVSTPDQVPGRAFAETRAAPPEAKDVPPGFRRGCGGALTLKAEPHELTMT